jgi:hypothetical protein
VLREAAGVDTNLPLDWENLPEEIESLADLSDMSCAAGSR